LAPAQSADCGTRWYRALRLERDAAGILFDFGNPITVRQDSEYTKITDDEDVDDDDDDDAEDENNNNVCSSGC